MASVVRPVVGQRTERRSVYNLPARIRRICLVHQPGLLSLGQDEGEALALSPLHFSTVGASQLFPSIH